MIRPRDYTNLFKLELTTSEYRCFANILYNPIISTSYEEDEFALNAHMGFICYINAKGQATRTLTEFYFHTEEDMLIFQLAMM